MNQEESLALHARGRDAWNAWARDRLAERERLKEAGKWVEAGDPNRWNDETRSWHESADVDFRKHKFDADVDFSGFSFPGYARFNRATFSGYAGFDSATFSGYAGFNSATFSSYAGFNSATFSGYARFESATFSGYASFNSATFSGDAWFESAAFSGDAWFESAAFSGDAWFNSATFSGYARFVQSVFGGLTRFDNARFERAARFYAATGKAGFSLTNASFGPVPDFVQAHFEEAPRLDNLRVESGRFFRFAGDPDLAARWRALKRLAIQGHDHQQEMAFLKGEMQALRWSVHKFWHAPFWFGLFYQWLSDFGRSMARPFWLWAAGVVWFASLYLVRHRAIAAGAPEPGCIAGAGTPWVEALVLSLRKGLLFLGAGSSDRLNQTYACLYGVHADESFRPGTLPASFLPVVPISVDILGLVQTVLSAALIFLFLLAIRNHFRIQ